MAYGLKYQSDFYNTPPFKTAVSVKIYKDDYTGAVTNVRTSEVSIEYNYVDDNTPIIGKGARIVIIANSSDMSYLEDLLLSYEKQFLCTIEYGSTVVFRGFSICDINERQLLPFAEITLQFTDYLHRTEGKYPTILQPIGGVNDLLTLVASLLMETELDFPLLINSTLFEDDMDMGTTDSFLPQVVLQNSIFYSDSYTHDNIYDAINKALSSFSAFIYTYNDQFIIERQEDITRTGDWVTYNNVEFDSDDSGVMPVGAVISSLRQSINKQAGDFEYIDMSQIIEYNSGLHTLILRLMDKKLDTLIFNDWPDADSIRTTPYYSPLADTLDYRNWYIHEDFTNIKVGEDRNGIAQWIHYTPSETFVKGLCYSFAVYFNQGSDEDTALSIAYSQGTDMDVSAMFHVGMYFFLRFDGGPYSDFFLTMTGPKTGGDPRGISGEVQLNLVGPNSIWYRSDCYNYQTIALSADDKEKKWDLSKEFNFSDMPVRLYNSGGGLFDQHNEGLQALLGFPEYQKFIITFCSPQYTVHEASQRIWQYPHLFADDVYTGDISVSVNAEEIDNKITYVLNQNFIKTEEVDLHLFDLENLNYANALLEEDGFTRTNLWTSENSSVPIPLYEIFAKCKFRKYGRTIHNLKASILTNTILKPFCLITDNNILNESGQVITFLLNGYTWDLVNARYDINAEEYTEEEVIVDGVTYDSSGEQEGMNTPPAYAPQIQSISRTPLLRQAIVRWTPVIGGVTGYILQRMPRYSVVQMSFISEWTAIYSGTETTALDGFFGPFTAGMTISYRVCAFNSAGNSSWSNTAQITY